MLKLIFKEKEVELKYIIVQIIYWMLFCATYAFANSFLSYKGFSSYQVGLIIAISSVISVFLQPLNAKFIEKYKKVTIRNTLIFSILSITFSLVLMMILNNLKIIFLAYIILVVGLLNSQTYMNTFIFEYINKGEKVNFGLARGMGSLSFAMASYMYGYLGSKIGFNFIPILSLIFSIIVILLIFSFKKIEKNINIEKKEKRNFKEFYLKYTKFVYFIIGIIFIYSGHSALNMFMLNILKELSKGSREVGIGFMLAAIVELPIMYIIVYLGKKLGYSNLIKISASVFSLKVFLTLMAVLTNNIYIFYIAQLTQIGGYAIYVPATVYYTNMVMEEKDKVKGQAYLASFATIGSILGNLLGGKLVENYSAIIMLVIFTFISMFGTIIVTINLKNVK